MDVEARGGGMGLDLVLKGRGVQITDRVREMVEHGAAKLEGPRRPGITRLEVEITEEPSPRIAGGHRVELTCVTTRPTFRAEASGASIKAALETALDRIDRQILTYRGKREAKVTRATPHGGPVGDQPDVGDVQDLITSGGDAAAAE
jgi:ribosomal subunit interface protein